MSIVCINIIVTASSLYYENIDIRSFKHLMINIMVGILVLILLHTFIGTIQSSEMHAMKYAIDILEENCNKSYNTSELKNTSLKKCLIGDNYNITSDAAGTIKGIHDLAILIKESNTKEISGEIWKIIADSSNRAFEELSPKR